VKILTKGNWGGISLVSLAIYPVGYKPQSGEIWFYPEVTVRFQLEQLAPNPRLQLKSDRIACGALNNIVQNKIDLPLAASFPPVISSPKITDGINGRYTIARIFNHNLWRYRPRILPVSGMEKSEGGTHRSGTHRGYSGINIGIGSGGTVEELPDTGLQ
jgi:hypothetical protein